jgi:hypothetical protein
VSIEESSANLYYVSFYLQHRPTHIRWTFSECFYPIERFSERTHVGAEPQMRGIPTHAIWDISPPEVTGQGMRAWHQSPGTHIKELAVIYVLQYDIGKRVQIPSKITLVPSIRSQMHYLTVLPDGAEDKRSKVRVMTAIGTKYTIHGCPQPRVFR